MSAPEMPQLPESTVIGPITVTRAELDALGGGRAALETLAGHLIHTGGDPEVVKEMRDDSTRLGELMQKLVQAVARQVAAQHVAQQQGKPS